MTKDTNIIEVQVSTTLMNQVQGKSESIETQRLKKVEETNNGSSENEAGNNIRNGNGQEAPHSLTLSTINPLILTFKAMEYAARGPVILRTLQIEKELMNGTMSKPFKKVVKANLGDAHAMGQKPITFLRQVLALATCPDMMELLVPSSVPRDVRSRVQTLLDHCRGESIGSYTDSRGLEIVRTHVAEYITHRDNGIRADPDSIFLSAGASDGIRACLKLLKSGPGMKKSGVLTPIPEYPLYNATLGEYDIEQIGYYLDEDDEWSINVDYLRETTRNARKQSLNPRAIVIINPGNPTGHILSRDNIEEIIKFAYREKLAIFADEVYQDNVYDGATFYSFKKVLMETGSPYSTSVELFSFYSCSKGYVCECGIRGGYCEVVNIHPEVRSVLQASIAAKLCPTVHGQIAVDCAVNPPRNGDDSYALFVQEKAMILEGLEEKAKLVEKTFNALPGMSVTRIRGAMYAFPQLILPEKAIEAAKDQGVEPDVFYCLQLVEETGICVVPGSGMGQLPGTYHFRSTILPPLNELTLMLTKLAEFHLKFMNKYSSSSDSHSLTDFSEKDLVR